MILRRNLQRIEDLYTVERVDAEESQAWLYETDAIDDLQLQAFRGCPLRQPRSPWLRPPAGLPGTALNKVDARSRLLY